MTSIRFTQTALAIAVAATLTSGVAAAAEQTMPFVNNNVLTGQAGDTLKTVSNKKYENKGQGDDQGFRNDPPCELVDPDKLGQHRKHRQFYG